MSLVKEHVIALVDCDCFYVSCERVDNPKLNGQPVCAVTNTTNKGIVLSRSKEAKALGIKMGAPMFQIKDEYPTCHYMPARYERYGEISKQVMEILRDFTPDVEEVSIDEAYLDLTGMSKLYGMTYENLIKKIRQTILDKTKIPVSIGLATSKTLAKLASDKAKKTGGIFIIPPSKIREILHNVNLEEICGISHQTSMNYWKKGVSNIDEFLDKEPNWIRKAFGINGERLRYELAGVSVSPVNPIEEAPQSIQDTRSLEDFTDSLDVLESTLSYHVHRASQKLRKWDGYCCILGVMLRTKDFKVFETETKLDVPTNSEQRLLRNAHELIEQLYKPRTLYRSTGISLRNLVFGQAKQQSLFESDTREDDKMSRMIDDLEKKFGKQVVKLGM
ncbi:MAG: Y-family DNA polymerase [Alphaproteobacteria bacterium]|nr:Y-family DNA polymerase [Alphaproteobacteria bacterium]